MKRLLISSAVIAFTLASSAMAQAPGQGQGIGQCRDLINCVGCAAAADSLKKWERLLSTLQQLLAADRQEKAKADYERDQARDKLYGIHGSVTGFCRGLMNLAAVGAGPVLKKVSDYFDKGLSVAGQDFANLAGDIAKEKAKDAAKDATDRAIVKHALGVGQNTMDVTHQASQAADAYLRNVRPMRSKAKLGGELLDVYGSANDFYDKTDALAADIQNYLDLARDAANLDKEIAELENWIKKITDDIAALKRDMEKYCSNSTGRPVGAMQRSTPFQFEFLSSVGRTREVPTGATRVATTELPSNALEAPLRKLRELLAIRMTRDANVARRIDVALAPLAFDLWRDADAAILVQLLQGVRSDIGIVDEEVKSALQSGRQIMTLLGQAADIGTIEPGESFVVFLGAGQQTHFMSELGDSHTVLVEAIDSIASKVMLLVRSDSQHVTLSIGKVARIDLNADRRADVTLELGSLELPQFVEIRIESATGSTAGIWTKRLGLLIAIVVAFVAYFALRRRRPGVLTTN